MWQIWVDVFNPQFVGGGLQHYVQHDILMENVICTSLFVHLSFFFELKLTVVTIVCDINVDKRCAEEL